MTAAGGVGPQAVVTSQNHQAFIIIASLLGLLWSVLVFAIRVYLRIHINGPFCWDDGAATVATVFGVAQTAVTLSSVHDGMGKNGLLLSSGEVDSALKKNYAANLLYLFAVCGAKCSLSLLVARLSQRRRHLSASYVLTGMISLWGFSAILAVAFQCSTPQTWNLLRHQHCATSFTRWAVIEAVSMSIEVLISLSAVLLVWNLHVAFRIKFIVVVSFSSQLLIIIPTTFRLIFLRRLQLSNDPTFDGIDSVITTQVVMHFSLMCATFPCMRKFLQAFDSGLGATTKMESELGYGSKSGSGGSYGLHSMDRDIPKPSRVKFRPDLDATNRVTTISTNGRGRADGRRSLESDGSDRAIIRTTSQFDITVETRETGG